VPSGREKFGIADRRYAPGVSFRGPAGGSTSPNVSWETIAVPSPPVPVTLDRGFFYRRDPTLPDSRGFRRRARPWPGAIDSRIARSHSRLQTGDHDERVIRL